MLARAVTRSLQTPTLRAAAPSFRTVSTQWTRNLASNSKRGVPKKPTEYSRPAGATSATKTSSATTPKTTGAAAAFGATRASQSASNEPEYSKKQDEVSGSATPDRNTTPPPDIRGPGAPAENAEKGNESDFSTEQDEFKTAASSTQNTAADAPSQGDPHASPDVANTGNFHLPDLTKGIPSTLEYELGNRSQTAGEEGDATREESQSPGSSGRGRGELPASAYVSSSERKRLKFANYMYAAFAVTCAASYVYFGRNWESEEEEKQHPEAPSGWALGLMWNRVRARTGSQLSYYQEPAFKKLLPDPDPSFERPYTLVLSLEDLLIHSEWSREHGWRMAKRPGVDYFLRYLSQYYELVIFTSVPWAIGEPVIKKLDPYHIVTWPLFREATMYRNGEYVKDLSYLNRDLSKVILIDTETSHTRAQPENSVVLAKWKGDPKDKELVSLIPFLEYLPAMATTDVRTALKSFEGAHIPTEFAKREAVARQRFQEQLAAEQKRKPKSGLGFISNALGVKPMTMMEGEQSPAEAFAQGKMLQDQFRERGQKNYEALEKMIREQGEQWLKEEAQHEEMAKQEGMKAMKSGLTGFFGVPSATPEAK